MPAHLTTKMLGDAGEHYALSQFAFAGMRSAKMPDGWPGYDLVVETDRGFERVSVKTRSESAGWKAARWFVFNEEFECDWLVFIFKKSAGSVHSWVVPFAAAKKHGNRPTASRKDPHTRYVYWNRLDTGGPLAQYENNWELRP